MGPTTVTELAIMLIHNAVAASNGESFNPWLLQLVNTRDIWIMPTTNSLGYYQNVREENNIDPNRDFPYYVNPSDVSRSPCMSTIAGRAVNELWRENLFQISLTYHGKEQIGY